MKRMLLSLAVGAMTLAGVSISQAAPIAPRHGLIAGHSAVVHVGWWGRHHRWWCYHHPHRCGW